MANRELGHEIVVHASAGDLYQAVTVRRLIDPATLV
jgi:hypothetical protein